VSAGANARLSCKNVFRKDAKKGSTLQKATVKEEEGKYRGGSRER